MTEIPVFFEDEWLAVIDKPSGLLVIPTPKKEKNTLTSLLNEGLIKKGVAYRLHPCHRLDRDTSGLIIYAKGKSTQQKMMDEFKNRQVRKSYIAFVSGTLKNGEGVIDHPIEGLSSVTEYRVIERRKDFTVVEVMPVTGRTNQIRIHFKGIGHPILGDSKFAFRRDFPVKAKRLCLHAQGVEFRHPVTKEDMALYRSMPQYLSDFLEEHA